MSDAAQDGAWKEVCKLDILQEDEPKKIDFDGEPVGLYRLKDEVFALHDICTHALAHLSEGWVEDEMVECPLHQGRFCIRTGKAQDEIAPVDVKTYEVRVSDGTVFLRQ